MAPSLLDDPPDSLSSHKGVSVSAVPSTSHPAPSLAGTVKVCSDPSILPSDKAPKRVKDLWWLHGHPHSTRYSDPGLVSLAALVRHAGQAFKGQTGFLYPVRSEATTPYKAMTWDEFDSVTDRIALSYAYEFRAEIKHANATHKQPTIALLGRGRSLEYFCSELALQKLGLRVLLLAESNSLDGLHHLLKSCEALAVITDSINAAADTNGVRRVPMISVISGHTNLHTPSVNNVKFQDFDDVWERHTFIIHSSGSTGMPKPIIHTNRSMMLIARMYRMFQNFSIENWFLLFPLYHIAGISIALSGLPNGQILSFPPLVFPTPSSYLFTAWQTLSSLGYPVDCVHCAPMVIENMYEHILDSGGDFSPLASLKLLQPGGAVLSDSIIKDLVEHGVNVKSTYGSTEIGPPFRSIPEPSNTRCYAFRNLYPDNPFLRMEKVGDGLYECVVYKGFELAADLWAGKHDDEPFRTNDLFTQEPPDSGFYVLKGRRDDILVHTNGENTSAGPLQLDIQAASRAIKNVLAIGHSLPSVGLLVEVYDQHDPAASETEELVWKAVEGANAHYPAHSQVLRSMIYILPRGETLEVTPKGNVKRRKMQKQYADAITRLYNLEESIVNDDQSTAEPLSEFLRNLFSRVSGVPPTEIQDWTTIFDLGIGSQLAPSIRCALSQRLGKTISINTIFEKPSISQLVWTFDHSPLSKLDSSLTSAQTIKRIIARLESEFNSWPPRLENASYPPTGSETILLTGCTGSLGANLLEVFSASPHVAKVYAMVRGPNHVDRVRKSLEKRGIDTGILDGVRVQVLNFSMEDPLLGLDIDTYYALSMSVTTVVHNSWKVDFNISVEEFESDCIRSKSLPNLWKRALTECRIGTMSLLRFCHAGRPKSMAFTSSIASSLGPGQHSYFIPESPAGNDPSAALSTGYAQSKYIIERITQRASLNSTLRIPVRIFRIGQLCGSVRTGIWKASEMYPSLIATAFHPRMRCLPTFASRILDWIPIDIAAQTISDLLVPVTQGGKGKGRTEPPQSKEDEKEDLSGSDGGGGIYTVHHVVNPTPIPWSTLLGILQSSTTTTAAAPLEEIPIADWVRRLSALADEGLKATDLPGLRLLGFFERLAEEERHSAGGGDKAFETARTRELSPALRDCGPICKEWIEGTLNVWRRDGFVSI